MAQLQAAQEAGLSLTDFILQSASRAASRVRKPEPFALAGSVPLFFRKSCNRARNGGEHGYEVAGYELARHLLGLHCENYPVAASRTERDGELRRLARLLRRPTGRREDRAVLGWFLRHYPQLMDLVPKRRYEQFLQGVYRCVGDGAVARVEGTRITYPPTAEEAGGDVQGA
jgi:hypothetical protein